MLHETAKVVKEFLTGLGQRKQLKRCDLCQEKTRSHRMTANNFRSWCERVCVALTGLIPGRVDIREALWLQLVNQSTRQSASSPELLVRPSGRLRSLLVATGGGLLRVPKARSSSEKGGTVERRVTDGDSAELSCKT